MVDFISWDKYKTWELIYFIRIYRFFINNPIVLTGMMLICTPLDDWYFNVSYNVTEDINCYGEYFIHLQKNL